MQDYYLFFEKKSQTLATQYTCEKLLSCIVYNKNVSELISCVRIWLCCWPSDTLPNLQCSHSQISRCFKITIMITHHGVCSIYTVYNIYSIKKKTTYKNHLIQNFIFTDFISYFWQKKDFSFTIFVTSNIMYFAKNYKLFSDLFLLHTNLSVKFAQTTVTIRLHTHP